MSNFTVPHSSSLPSTPDPRRRQPTDDLTESLTSNPSTTPAGPPNPQLGSFTPAGPPPSTPFGSSQVRAKELEVNANSVLTSFGSGVQTSDAHSFARQLESSPAVPDPWVQTDNGTPAKPRSGPQGETMENSQAESGIDEDAEEETHNAPMSDSRGEFEGDTFNSSKDSSFLLPMDDRGSVYSTFPGPGTQSVLRGTKRSHAGGIIDQHQHSTSLLDAGQQRANPSPIPAIARDLAAQSRPATLHEPDDMILGTEAFLDRLDHWRTSLSDGRQTLNGTISFVTEKILELWRSMSELNNSELEASNDHSTEIGPKATASQIEKATFLTDLLLPIHHPPQLRTSSAFSQTRAPGKPYPIPRILLDWLAKHHDPYRDALSELSAHQPNPTCHIYFWEITLSAVLRGKLDGAIRILKQADFRHPQVVLDDNLDQPQLPEMRLGSIRMVINRAIQILEQCPANTDDNWDVNGNDWSVFRLKVSQARRDLKALSGDADSDEDETAKAPFSAEHFGIGNSQTEANSLTKASRQAQSKVPWTVYQNLNALYGILGGDATAILAYAQDWIEASLGLTIWWNGGYEPSHGDSPKSRELKVSLSRSLTRQGIDPGTLYLERLAWSFNRATDPNLQDSFQVDTLNKVEVGLASILEGNTEGVIGLLRGWSLIITAAVILIAKRGGWLEPSSGGNLLTEFDQSDLMVLSYNQPKMDEWKDDVLIQYAEALFSRDRLRGNIPNRDASSSHGGKRMVEHEGWELGIQVLGRLDDIEVASKKVAELLDRLPLNSGGRVDKLLRICRAIGLSGQALRIAEVIHHVSHLLVIVMGLIGG